MLELNKNYINRVSTDTSLELSTFRFYYIAVACLIISYGNFVKFIVSFVLLYILTLVCAHCF